MLQNKRGYEAIILLSKEFLIFLLSKFDITRTVTQYNPEKMRWISHDGTTAAHQLRYSLIKVGLSGRHFRTLK